MMKYLLITILCVGFAQSQEYKAIFDCSSDDARYIMTRMSLVEKTMDMIEMNDDKVTVAITLHGGCVAMASKNYSDIVNNKDLIYIKKAQERIRTLALERDVEITVCAMSLNANAIEKEEVLPFVKISENSFIDTIIYQNRGYALMVLK